MAPYSDRLADVDPYPAPSRPQAPMPTSSSSTTLAWLVFAAAALVVVVFVVGVFITLGYALAS